MGQPLPFNDRVRKGRGRMTQKALAEHAGVSVSTIKRIEKRGSGSMVERKGLALVLVEAADAPPELFAEELGGLASPQVSLEQDVAELREEVRVLGRILGRAPAVKGEELRHWLERLEAKSPGIPEMPGEGRGQ